MTKPVSTTVDRRYWDAIQIARSMAADKEAGNQGSYESKMFRFAVLYADIFTDCDQLDYDRLELLDTLSGILPDYFSNSFTKYGRFIS